MKFHETPLKGSFTLDLEKQEDEKGFCACIYNKNEYEKWGLSFNFVQINNFLTHQKGTLRGMHYQIAPKEEAKVIRCIKGSIYDVILDLRPKSPTFGKSFGTVLNAQNRKMIVIPKGFAHGFLTLEEQCEILCIASEFDSSEHERGIRWNDPHFNIEWPSLPIVISAKDSHHPNFSSSYHLGLS